MIWCLHLERTLLRLADAFDTAALEFVVLKGPALAHSAYPEPSWRSFGDLDILVRSAAWGRACALLESEGFRRRLPEPRPGFDVRFGKGGPFVDIHRVEVDLHRTLVSGPFGVWTNADALFEQTTTFMLAGRPIRRLEDETTLVHACIHASLGSDPPRLLSVRDLAQVLARRELDWEVVARLVRTWRLGAVVQHSFGLVEELLGRELPDPARRLAAALAPDRAERRALRAYVDGSRGWGAKSVAELRAITGVRSKVAFVWALTFPTREFLDARGAADGEGSYVGRWMVPFRWMLPRRRTRSSRQARRESSPRTREGVGGR
jgi:hypothetical protein